MSNKLCELTFPDENIVSPGDKALVERYNAMVVARAEAMHIKPVSVYVRRGAFGFQGVSEGGYAYAVTKGREFFHIEGLVGVFANLSGISMEALKVDIEPECTRTDTGLIVPTSIELNKRAPHV